MSEVAPPLTTISSNAGADSRNKLAMSMRRSNSGRVSADRNGSVPLPVGTAQRPFGAGQGDLNADLASMGMPRSPPKNKNTQHVPCKFFIYGQCQAGRTCPFSHDLESTTRPAPCKYFAKGSCKFGRKCALLHVTPDGTIVNRPQAYPSAGQFPAAQAPAGAFGAQPPPPGLLAQGLERVDVPYDRENLQFGARAGYDLTSAEMNYPPGSPPFGSPLQDHRFTGSPPAKGISVLDVPLPNSFDSNGISMAARNGPFAASVPSRFGVESPPSSLPSKSRLGNTALRDLHNSAFGDRGMDGVLAGSSPPSGPDEPLTFPKRSLHSERFAQRQIISASLGTRLPTQSLEYSDDDDDADLDREGDLLPASLHDLIPEGRSRRESRSRPDEGSTPAGFLAAQRRTLSSHGTPQDSKAGSPHSSSPSRFSGVFMRNRSENDNTGHVGSPLRNAGLVYTPSSLPRTRGDLSPTLSSPPRQASMSILTQELQRTKLDAALSQAAATSPVVGIQRSISNGSTGRSSLDRTFGSQSIGRERIDEEELFDMDEVGDQSKGTAPRNISNGTGAWGSRRLSSSPHVGSPTFGAIGGHRTGK